MKSSQAEARSPSARAIAAPNAYPRYALFLLMLVYATNYLDRQILSILLQPLKNDLHLSDAQLGALSGFAFAMFYATLGIPVAMWADRWNRRNIIVLALLIFSAMTALCGLATNFWQLALARIGVGIGEAGTSPPSHAMIADMVPTRRRASAMGIYGLGSSIGVLISFVAGGWISQLYGWRTAFLVVGLPGLLVAAIVLFTLREPVRGISDRIAERETSDAPTLLEVSAFLWEQRSFRQIALGAALASFCSYGTFAWAPSFLARSFAMKPGEIGTVLALVIGLVGGAGTYFSGVLADYFGRRDVRWNLWILAITALACFPFLVAVYLSDTKTWAVIFLLVPAYASAAHLGPTLAMTQSVAPLRMRATSSAIYLLIVNLIGLGLGPFTVGVVSDLYARRMGAESLRYALLTASIMWLPTAYQFVRGTRTLKADIARAMGGSFAGDDAVSSRAD